MSMSGNGPASREEGVTMCARQRVAAAARVVVTIAVFVVLTLAWKPAAGQSAQAQPAQKPPAPDPSAQNPLPAERPIFKVEVIETTPLPGLNLKPEQVPAPVQTAVGADIEASGALDLSDFLNRRFNGVFVNEIDDRAHLAI